MGSVALDLRTIAGIPLGPLDTMVLSQRQILQTFCVGNLTGNNAILKGHSERMGYHHI